MVPLRSKYPNTGRVTLRNVTPRFDMPFDIDLAVSGVPEKTTTSQVVPAELEAPSGRQQTEDETAAGKGGEAR
jgi:hypothetical protein